MCSLQDENKFSGTFREPAAPSSALPYSSLDEKENFVSAGKWNKKTKEKPVFNIPINQINNFVKPAFKSESNLPLIVTPAFESESNLPLKVILTCL